MKTNEQPETQKNDLLSSDEPQKKGSSEIEKINALLESEIAERKRAERALSESQELLRDLLENANDLIQCVDISGRFLYVNRAWRQTLGYEPDEIAQMSLLDIVHPDSKNHCMEAFKQVISGKPANDIVATFVSKDRRKIAVEGSANCHFVNGKPSATRSVFRNVTERKHIETKLADLSKSEKSKKQEHETETNARSQFINVLAHELRTPLTPLIASAGLLEETFRHKSESAEYRLANVLLSGAHSLSRRLSDLLDLARLMTGKITLRTEIFDIKPVMLKVYSEFVVQAAERDQSLEIKVPDGLLDIEADKPHIEQMLSNLISNAINFNNTGKAVVLRAKAKKQTLTIEVEDHGDGISPQEQQMIFQPYHHVQQDRQRFAGLGLGLAISKHIVEAHCGTITLKSEAGKGNVFTVTLPLENKD
ncbi:ATP-binding protein [Chloroflexota bacterium]